MDTRKNRVNAAPVSFGVLHLNALALALKERYPDIEIDIEIDMTLNDRFIDLAIEGVDVALRIGGDWPQDVVARQVAAFERTVVASPAYLKTHAKIRRVDDIA
ncbi:LysR substrate-binding domain-containing protein, partial [Trinickia sp.]|uniref:LysR substrate-binding domain-containing protein n=1 Tax=Trinickia sp. TaxID=2571163 RepID=UPI003F811717